MQRDQAARLGAGRRDPDDHEARAPRRPGAGGPRPPSARPRRSGCATRPSAIGIVTVNVLPLRRRACRRRRRPRRARARARRRRGRPWSRSRARQPRWSSRTPGPRSATRIVSAAPSSTIVSRTRRRSARQAGDGVERVLEQVADDRHRVGLGQPLRQPLEPAGVVDLAARSRAAGRSRSRPAAARRRRAARSRPRCARRRRGARSRAPRRSAARPPARRARAGRGRRAGGWRARGSARAGRARAARARRPGASGARSAAPCGSRSRRARRRSRSSASSRSRPRAGVRPVDVERADHRRRRRSAAPRPSRGSPRCARPGARARSRRRARCPGSRPARPRCDGEPGRPVARARARARGRAAPRRSALRPNEPASRNVARPVEQQDAGRARADDAGGLGGDAVEQRLERPAGGDEPADREHGGELRGGLERLDGRHAVYPPAGMTR